MCTSKQSYTRSAVYEAIQATVACVQTTSRLWLLKMENTDNSLFFDMAPRIDLAKYEINIIELGGFNRIKIINTSCSYQRFDSLS